MPRPVTESDVEDAALEILRELGYDTLRGPDIGPDGEDSSLRERASYSDVVLEERFRKAIFKVNSKLDKGAIEEGVRKVLKASSVNLLEGNETFHNMLVNGVEVEYRGKERIQGENIKLIDFENPENNEFLAVNQFTVIEDKFNRRPDIVLFVNGLPLSVIELKNPVDTNATLWSAYEQIQTYKEQIPSLFRFNEICIISDSNEARAGTITSSKEWFLPWKTINGIEKAPNSLPQMFVLIKGIFGQKRFLDIIRNFIAFQKNKKNTKKILSAYHQYHAVKKALLSTLKATKKNHKCGIVWHTQGSGKSFSMVFYSAKLIQNKELNNPTIVVLTDRNDLDDQLFNTFSSCSTLLRWNPSQVKSREELAKLLNVSSGGIVFTTIQKFMPESYVGKHPLLSNRNNIIVIADEAHRSQYGFDAKVSNSKENIQLKYGYAKYLRDALPNASFIGFTGTPIELEDKSTTAVFGNYIDVYDIEQAVEDRATVKIYYESRLAKLKLKENEKPNIDPNFEEITEKEEEQVKERLKSKWARVEAIVGSEKRIRAIAKDIVNHYEGRQEIIEGKAMIVSMSRRICVDLYNEIAKIRPDWVDSEDSKGKLKIIMTGSASDPLEWQKHIRSKPRRREMGERFKDPTDNFSIVIVRDMWLTGFDVPSLNTIYLDKPMKGHTLMQAIARVNRVFKDKQGGLVVDYLGVAEELKKALNTYTKSGGKGKPINQQEEAVTLMKRNYEIVRDMYFGFNYTKFFSFPSKEKLLLIPAAMEHILNQKNGKKRYLKNIIKLNKAYSLAVPHEDALKIRDEIAFFQAVRAGIVKNTESTDFIGKENLDTAIRQIVSKAVSSNKIVDIFKLAGLDKPDISVFSDEFLAEVKSMKYKNLAAEALQKLLKDEIKIRERKNIIEAKQFSLLLENAIKRYENRSIEAAQVVSELIEIAKKIRDSKNRKEELNLSDEELAFYDALADNENAKEVLGNDSLMNIARELTEIIRKNTTIDWNLRESARAKIKVMVKRLLRKNGYPPDKQERATELVLEQATLLSAEFASSF